MENLPVLKTVALHSLVCVNYQKSAPINTGRVPVNLKNEDGFHITIEEYLHALVSLTEELSRLAINAVTLGDYSRPIQISKFVKVSTSLSIY